MERRLALVLRSPAQPDEGGCEADSVGAVERCLPRQRARAEIGLRSTTKRIGRTAASVLHLCSTMKTASVRELRNRYTQLLKWLEAGEEITITRRGVAIARLVPANGPKARRSTDWHQSAAFALDRLRLRPLTEQQSAELLDQNKGQY